MDPTTAPGEQLTITSLDLTAFDVIGWNLTSTPSVSAPTVATPAPASALVFAFGLAGLGFTRRRTLA
jgi:MYXO-CTERM domain-containing protein